MSKSTQNSVGLLGTAKIGLLTITEQELTVVRDVFGLHENIPESGYWASNGSNSNHGIVLRRSSAQTNLISAESAGDIVQDFRPAFILLIGTAGGYGGRDGLNLGDVVISDYVEFSGYWKYKENQVLRRKIAHDHPSLYLRDNFIEPLRVTPEQWRAHIRAQRPAAGEPSLYIGEIVSGDILLGDPDNAEQKRILDCFDKALAFEMEAVGLARTVFKARRWVHYNPQFLIIRGISDLVNANAPGNQETRVAWTPYAVSAATAVAKVLSDRVLQALRARDLRDVGFWRRIGGAFGIQVIS